MLEISGLALRRCAFARESLRPCEFFNPGADPKGSCRTFFLGNTAIQATPAVRAPNRNEVTAAVHTPKETLCRKQVRLRFELSPSLGFRRTMADESATQAHPCCESGVVYCQNSVYTFLTIGTT
jgi:hypothetical protein